MKKKHTTRHQRQAVRQIIARQVQDMENCLLPRRAALALLRMHEAASDQHALPARSQSGESEARG